MAIRNVFTHMLNELADKNNNDSLRELASEMKQSVTQRPIEDLFSANVPYIGERKINLLKVQDMNERDLEALQREGYGDALNGIIQAPEQRLLSYNNIDLQVEELDPMTKNTITFQFVGFRTPGKRGLHKVPERFYMVMRFFTL